MRKINVLIGLCSAAILVWFTGGCAVTPLYDDTGYFSAGPNVAVYAPPLFLHSPFTGFYSAVGIPYDLYYIDHYYYLYHKGLWYRSHHYNGPWGSVKYKSLPHSVIKHRYEDIIRWRDSEYRSYQKDRNRYKGRFFRPEIDKVKKPESRNKLRYESFKQKTPNKIINKQEALNTKRHEPPKKINEKHKSVSKEQQPPNGVTERHDSLKVKKHDSPKRAIKKRESADKKRQPHNTVTERRESGSGWIEKTRPSK